VCVCVCFCVHVCECGRALPRMHDNLRQAAPAHVRQRGYHLLDLRDLRLAGQELLQLGRGVCGWVHASFYVCNFLYYFGELQRENPAFPLHCFS
jgi:hypothetical protein